MSAANAGFAPGAVGKSVAGFFVLGSDSVETATDTTDASGESTIQFIPGFIGGEVEIIASSAVSAVALADTVIVSIKVPGLVNIRPVGDTLAYFVGGKGDSTSVPPVTYHRQDSIWFSTPQYRDSLLAVVAVMQAGGYYMQVNDLSLSHGGSYTYEPASGLTEVDPPGVLVEDPFGRHRSHAMGIDGDLGSCYATSVGMDIDQDDRVADGACSGNQLVVWEDLQYAASRFGLRVIRESDHFHLRPFSSLTYEAN
jgi:hypothetical protein